MLLSAFITSIVSLTYNILSPLMASGHAIVGFFVACWQQNWRSPVKLAIQRSNLTRLYKMGWEHAYSDTLMDFWTGRVIGGYRIGRVIIRLREYMAYNMLMVLATV